LKWAVEISEFDFTFHPRPTLKSQVLADFMIESSVLITLFKYVDGASSYKGDDIKITMIGLHEETLNYVI
jgi:hypothetical protein